MKLLTVFTPLTMVIALGFLAGAVLADDDDDDDERSRVVLCPEKSIQRAVDRAKRATTIRFSGVCEEIVTIAKDDITLDGRDEGTVSGTIVFDGARRGVVKRATVTGPGSGIVAKNGASVLIHDNTITENGDPGDNYSPGVQIVNGSSAQVRDNEISDNTSDGIGVFNGAFAEIANNMITGNGRISHFEAGIQVSRANAKGQSNTVAGNPYAALSVFNDGSYRTGSFLVAATQPDNDGPAEVLSAGAGGTAVDMGQMAYVDLRQVAVTGTVFVGRQSMLQVRGDNVGASQTCSVITGNLSVFGFNSGARLRFTNVTGALSGTIDGSGICP